MLLVPDRPLSSASSPPETKKTSLEWIEVVAKKRPADEVVKNFVRQVEVPKDYLTDEKKPTNLGSEREQFVKEQMQARRTGLAANRIPGIPDTKKDLDGGVRAGLVEKIPKTILSRLQKLNMRPTPIWKSEVVKGKALEKGLAEDFSTARNGDVEIRKPSAQKPTESAEQGKPFAMPNFAGLRLGGESTSGYRMPSDIKFGDFTVLNTERYLYYSFFSRAEEMIRPHWITAVRAALFTLQQTTRIRGDEAWTSRIEFLLDKEGKFVKALVNESSGQVTLDQAAVLAFRRAEQIPNPPQEMVKDDGFIHMNYTFTVNFVPQYADSE